jgi:hypothetical protein
LTKIFIFARLCVNSKGAVDSLSAAFFFIVEYLTAGSAVMVFSTLPKNVHTISKDNGMKKTLLCAIPCLLLGTGVFFTVNHAARARLIVAAVGELPNIPGCPLHESCVRALQEEQTALAPLFPAAKSGGIAGAGAAALMGAAFLLFVGKKREQPAAV